MITIIQELPRSGKSVLAKALKAYKETHGTKVLLIDNDMPGQECPVITKEACNSLE